MAKTVVVGWDKIKEYQENISPAEKKLIEKAFRQHLEGTDDYVPGTSSSPEMQGYFQIFRDGWITAMVFCK